MTGIQGIIQLRRTWWLLLLLSGSLVVSPLQAQRLEFSLHQHEGEQRGPTLLVIGGIQGDEPGGFNAASLLVTEYRVTRGQVWVVPNLNFESIIQRSRGVYGDMNRKFLRLQEADPEYAQIQKIKSIILNSQVDVILNLHDGSGFYAPTWRSRLANPDRWGQSLIIDQESVPGIAHGNLQEIGQRVVAAANQQIANAGHRYHIKNTQTRLGNEEMEKTLTYFAIRHGKSAFGIEASKEFVTHERAYFHLQVVEAFMRELGIGYERDFTLSQRAVRQRIDGNVQLALFGNRIFLDMVDVRRSLSYIPIKKDAPLDVTPSNPLIAVLSSNKALQVRYGNRHITHLEPFYTEYDDSRNSLTMQLDAQRQDVELGSVLTVHDSFKVETLAGYRVNVIGYRRAGSGDDAGVTIRRRDLLQQFSVDRKGQLYRVELYHAERFCGMVLVRFEREPVARLTIPELVADGG